MDKHFSYQEFCQELKNDLPASDADKRIAWARLIVENKVDLAELSLLLHEDRTIAMRYAWLLTDIAIIHPQTLFEALPFLLKESKNITHFAFTESFANYWLIAGVPIENEAKAINMLFEWISSGEVNVTVKSRALKVLVKLTAKYPEIRNELSLHLKEQMNQHGENFKNKAVKLLNELES